MRLPGLHDQGQEDTLDRQGPGGLQAPDQGVDGQKLGCIHGVPAADEVGDSTRLQQQQLLADVQNPGDQPGHLQRVVTGTRFAQRERPVVQGTGLYGKEEKRESFVERADLLFRPLRTRTVGGVGAGS